QEFYVLSNFSSFRVEVDHIDFQTAEHAYHYYKFPHHAEIQGRVLCARSAHEAYKIGQTYKNLYFDKWDEIKISVMHNILRAKVNQHEYVRRKLLETMDRTLVEDSWRDNFWGIGPNKDGENWLGNLWMQVRNEVRSVENATAKT